MKANGTRLVIFAMLAELLFLLISLTVAAQPEYVFRNGALVAGADKKEGAKYRFNNVRSGTDAFVTITKIDKVTLNQLDGPSGFDEAFQPYIQCPANTRGYVEFRFDFLLHGTDLPMLMLEVPVTAIDVDGSTTSSGKAHEFDEFNLSLGYLINFDLLGLALGVNFKGTEVEAINSTGNDYPGIDTVQRDVMFTMTYAAVTSITIRAGVDNQTNQSVERLRSDYFKKFSFANSYLALPALVSFTGLEKNNKVDLQWQVNTDNSLSKVIIEKGTSPSQFKEIGEVWMNTENVRKTQFGYTDNSGMHTIAYYRLKMLDADGDIHYSNVLVFRAAAVGAAPFKVYPSVVNSSVNVSLQSDRLGQAMFQVVDFAGRVITNRNISVREGNNNVMVAGLDQIIPGNYVVVLKTNDGQVHSQKIIKQ